MELKPTITVIMSCFNEPVSYARQAIDSILAQTFTDFEFIIVLDNPVNHKLSILLAKYAERDSRIKVIVHEKPKGLATARNRAISEASGKFVALMDADDIAKPSRLVEQYDYARKNNSDFLFSQATYIDEQGKEIGSFITTFSPKTLRRDIFLRHMFIHPTGFIKKEVFDILQYDENFLRAQDVDLWIRGISKKYVFGVVPKYLLEYRIHRGDTPDKRLDRQQLYMKYGFKLFIKHHRTYWYYPPFWYFAFKYIFYYLALSSIPKKLLSWVMNHRDQRRNIL